MLDFAASLLGIERGAYQDPGRGARRAQRARSENKRVKSARLVEKLSYRLQYPDYKAGLSSLATGTSEGVAVGGARGAGEGER